MSPSSKSSRTVGAARAVSTDVSPRLSPPNASPPPVAPIVLRYERRSILGEFLLISSFSTIDFSEIE
jgi:hypothetical protein